MAQFQVAAEVADEKMKEYGGVMNRSEGTWIKVGLGIEGIVSGKSGT